MKTRERIAGISHAFPRQFSRPALEGVLREQLGNVEVLDRWIPRNGRRIRAIAPKTIYHLCAGNLAVSAVTSIVHGLLLGARNFVKLPSAREESAARQEIVTFVRGLSPALRELTTLHSALDERALRRADVIIAFGSDATMEALRQQSHARQRFIAHGHAVSLLWMAKKETPSKAQARACAIDILTYDQLGCLSPQAIYLPRDANITKFSAALAEALEDEWRTLHSKPKRGLGVAALVQEARDLARAQGHDIWLPASRHLGWTVIHDPNPVFKPSPLHGVIYLRPVLIGKLAAALKPVAGRISTVGVVGRLSPPDREMFLKLGVTRFCRAGQMQFPPLTWHHDGRPSISDLVTWSEVEG